MSKANELPEERTLQKKETIELLLGFHDRHRDRLNVRLSHSWKINLALWSALGLLAGSLMTGTATVAQNYPATIVGGAVMIFATYLLWVCVIAKNNISDRDIARRYMDLATSKLKEVIPTNLPQKDSECWLKKYHSQILQVAITICLIGLVVLAYWGRGAALRKTDYVNSQNSSTQPSHRTYSQTIKVWEK